MRRRRWLQFSLSSVFLLVTVFGVWLGIVVNHARKQREAVAAIEAAEGWVAYDWQDRSGNDPFGDEVQTPPGLSWLRRLVGDEYFQSIYFVNLQNAKISDDLMRHVGGQTSITDLRLDNPEIGDHELAFLSGLRHLQRIDFRPFVDVGSVDIDLRISAAGLQHFRRLRNLKSVLFFKSAIGDAGLAVLGEISTLEDLSFVDPQVTDAGIEHLKLLKNLRYLWFKAPQVTDEGFKHLERLTELEVLEVDGTKITDAAFESLAGLSELQELNVITHGDQTITDAGLLRLKGLSKLKTLNIPNRGITDQGVKELQQAIPGCKISCK